MLSVRRSTGAESAAIAVAVMLAALATQLDWATVSSGCANTGATRGLGETESGIAWDVLYLVGIVAAAASVLVHRFAAALLVIGGAMAVVSLAFLATSLTAPFEALRPAASGGPIGTLCGFDLAIGFWLALAAVASVAVATALRARRGPAGA